MVPDSGVARLGPVEELDLRPVFQPIVDLRSEAIVGYEALMRSGAEDGELHGAEALLAAARREDSTVALDLAARDAALRLAAEHGLDAPFSLFLNADPETLDAGSPELPSTPFTLLVEVTEPALIARPEAMLRALTRLRSAGWGIALDDVGGDSRSLALMSILYPDVIKIDLRLLAGRERADVARVVTAVCAEAERRHASVLAEGIDSEEQLATARTFGATLGQGYLLGAPAALPAQLPAGGPSAPPARRRERPVRRHPVGARDELAPSAPRHARAGDPRRRRDRRPARSSSARPRWCSRRSPTSRSARRRTPATGGSRSASRSSACSTRARRSTARKVRGGTLAADDPLRGSGTLVALAPEFAACYVVRQLDGDDEWEFAITYDRDTVVECALPLMARMEPLAG